MTSVIAVNIFTVLISYSTLHARNGDNDFERTQRSLIPNYSAYCLLHVANLKLVLVIKRARTHTHKCNVDLLVIYIPLKRPKTTAIHMNA